MVFGKCVVFGNSMDPRRCQLVAPGGGGGGGGYLIWSYIRRLESFLGFEILNFNIFWGFHKNMNIFGGMKILWIFLG